MRSNPFKSLALMFLMMASASSAFGQVTNVIDWNTVWKYSQGGVLPAANWMTNTYSDTAWPTGQGVLGFPAGESLTNSGASLNTILSSTDTNGVYIFTYYFRTTFVLSTTNGVTLMASNLLDDGAVIYLNGREVARPGMAAGAVAYTTQATRGGDIIDSGHGIDAFAIPISFARAGTNLVAVEVHQNGTASSDMIMGMRIVADIPNPPTITQQPQDITVDAGQTGMFTVVATGTTPLTYRWYTNGILVPNLNSATYTTPTTTLAMDGIMVYVTVSNRFGLRTSTTNVLTVVQDVNGPVMLSALALTTNAFEIRFNETITQASSQNVSNYIVRILGTTNSLVVTQAQWGINRSSLRVNGTFAPNTNYVVCICGIADQRGNVTCGDCIGITGLLINTNMFQFVQPWRFNENSALVGPPSNNWMTRAYIDDPQIDFAWAEALTPMGDDQVFGGSLCVVSPQGANLTLSPTTYYFRKWFSLSESYGTNVSVVLRHTIDDGAVFYLNGTEFHRFNMPQGAVTYATRASNDRDATCMTETIPISGNLLVLGTNLLAIELHQSSDGGSQIDVWFDLELNLAYRRTPLIPSLSIVRQRVGSITNIIVSWVGTGWQLQNTVTPSGSWTNLTSTLISGTNRYTGNMAPLGPRRFYRLKNP